MFLIESQQKERNTDLIVFSRNKEGQKEVKVVSNFEPYFFVSQESIIPDDNRNNPILAGIAVLRPITGSKKTINTYKPKK